MNETKALVEAAREKLIRAAIRVRARCQTMRFDPDAAAALSDLDAALQALAPFDSSPPSVGGGDSSSVDESGTPSLRSVETSAQNSAGWLPIDSAPRDGTSVLLFCPGGRPRVVSANWLDLPDGWQFDDERLCAYGPWPPSHWMPLPSPPAENSAVDRPQRSGGSASLATDELLPQTEGKAKPSREESNG